LLDDVEDGVTLLLAEESVHATKAVEADIDDPAGTRRTRPQRTDESGALEDMCLSAGERSRPLDEQSRIADREETVGGHQ
jgi:hypothetical protein